MIKTPWVHSEPRGPPVKSGKDLRSPVWVPPLTNHLPQLTLKEGGYGYEEDFDHRGSFDQPV